MFDQIVAFIVFFGPLFGGFFSLWWFTYRDIPNFLRAQTTQTQFIPASLGFLILSAASFFFLALSSTSSVTGSVVITMSGLVLSVVGIFLPYIFTKQGQRRWQFVPSWIKHTSLTLFLVGMLPMFVVGVVAINMQHAWLSIVAILVSGTGLGFFVRGRRQSSIPAAEVDARPGVVNRDSSTFSSVETEKLKQLQSNIAWHVWYMGALLLVAAVDLLGHRFGLW